MMRYRQLQDYLEADREDQRVAGTGAFSPKLRRKQKRSLQVRKIQWHLPLGIPAEGLGRSESQRTFLIAWSILKPEQCKERETIKRGMAPSFLRPTDNGDASFTPMSGCGCGFTRRSGSNNGNELRMHASEATQMSVMTS